MQIIIKDIVNWLNDFLKKSKKDDFVLGISGGIDSAVLAILLNKYFPNKYITYWIDVDSFEIDNEYADLLVKNKKIISEKINLNKTFDQIKEDLSLNESNLGNVKSRLRMITLYAKAQKLNYLVIGTTNMNEHLIGYFTKFGDSACDLAPLKDLVKSEIYEMAKILEVPEEIISREPTAGLYEYQTDEKEIGISYIDMDKFFLGEIISKELESEMKNKIISSSHKRDEIPYPKIKKK